MGTGRTAFAQVGGGGSGLRESATCREGMLHKPHPVNRLREFWVRGVSEAKRKRGRKSTINAIDKQKANTAPTRSHRAARALTTALLKGTCSLYGRGVGSEHANQAAFSSFPAASHIGI